MFNLMEKLFPLFRFPLPKTLNLPLNELNNIAVHCQRKTPSFNGFTLQNIPFNIGLGKIEQYYANIDV